MSATASSPSSAPSPEALARPVVGGNNGQPLPTAIQHRLESQLGADLSAVRVHHDHQATMVGARAYTQGNNIYFAPGQYDPGSPAGLELIAHEAAHVVQQRAGVHL